MKAKRLLLTAGALALAFALSGWSAPAYYATYQRGSLNGTSLSAKTAQDTIALPAVPCYGAAAVYYTIHGDSSIAVAATCSLVTLQFSHDGVNWISNVTTAIGGFTAVDSLTGKNINNETLFYQIGARALTAGPSSGLPYEWLRLLIRMNGPTQKNVSSIVGTIRSWN